MTQIVTDSSIISDAATALSTQRGEFSAAHQALFKVVADSSEYWKDNAGASYISEVTKYATTFEEFTEYVQSIITFLNTAAATYESTQTEVSNMVKNI